MFDKFGEFDSFNEINELAENLLNEGDIESIKVVAKENGIQADFVDLYTHGEIPELCDKLTAALGKIDVEAAELKPKEIMEDWVEYLRGQCMENELLERIIESLQTGPRNRQEKRALESKLRRRKNPHKSLKNQSLRALKRKKMKPKA